MVKIKPMLESLNRKSESLEYVAAWWERRFGTQIKNWARIEDEERVRDTKFEYPYREEGKVVIVESETVYC